MIKISYLWTRLAKIHVENGHEQNATINFEEHFLGRPESFFE